MVNFLTLVEVANSTNTRAAVNYPIKKAFKPAADDVVAFRETLKSLPARFIEENGTFVVLLNSKEDLNCFAEFYFESLFKAQLKAAESKDAKIKRSFREVISGIRPTPHTIVAEAAIVEVAARLNRCGVKV